MIIYENDKKDFFNDVRKNLISDIILKNLRKCGVGGGTRSEILSWNNSLNQMKNVLETEDIPNDVYVAIEYKIPFSSKRIDFIVSGYDQNENKNILVIELKQWNEAEDTGKKDFVLTFVGGNKREVIHPSYQASSYKYLLESFNEVLSSRNVNCFTCAYLHNASKLKNKNLNNNDLYTYVNESKIYFKEDYDDLQNQIVKLVGKGKGKEVFYQVEKGKIVPSKKLVDVVAKSLKNSNEFMLIDSQKFVFENIMSKLNETNNVFIVNGNPGTGKSVVAINLLASLLNQKQNTVFVAPNTSFRNTLEENLKKQLKDSKEKLAWDVLFKGSGSFYGAIKNSFDWIIVDEAHRLKDKAYMYKGENQIEDILVAGKNVVFFVDEYQAIRPNDIGNNKNIVEIANSLNKKIYQGEEYFLQTQFRCSGADGYINALDTILQIQETANIELTNNGDYEFKICETPQEMEKLIRNKINEGYKNSRIVAGFAWKWNSKELKLDELRTNHDVVIEEYNYSIPWNYNDPKMLWATKEFDFLQAGCVHTVQGLEFDYCGVIVGNDLKIDGFNNIYADINEYKDNEGKKGLKNKPHELTKLVKNIYKVLMTRGQKGTFVFIRNKELREYFKQFVEKSK